jgi:hypothetical protein
MGYGLSVLAGCGYLRGIKLVHGASVAALTDSVNDLLL